jgi:hypothetical protein
MMANNAGMKSQIDVENQPNRKKFSNNLKKSKHTLKKGGGCPQKVEDLLKPL